MHTFPSGRMPPGFSHTCSRMPWTSAGPTRSRTPDRTSSAGLRRRQAGAGLRSFRGRGSLGTRAFARACAVCGPPTSPGSRRARSNLWVLTNGPRRRWVDAPQPSQQRSCEFDGTRQRERVPRKDLERESASAHVDVRLRELLCPIQRIRRSVRDRHEQRPCRCHEVVMRFGALAQNAAMLFPSKGDEMMSSARRAYRHAVPSELARRRCPKKRQQWELRGKGVPCSSYPPRCSRRAL